MKTGSAVVKISDKKRWVMLIWGDRTKVQRKADVGISAGTIRKLNEGKS